MTSISPCDVKDSWTRLRRVDSTAGGDRRDKASESVAVVAIDRDANAAMSTAANGRLGS